MFSRALLSAAVLVLVFQGGAVPAGAEYQAKGRRDPFVRLLTAEGQRIHPPGVADARETQGVEGLVLQGILYQPDGDSYAVLNGQVVRVQEEFQGVKILDIHANEVTVWVDGQEHRLTFSEATEEKTEP